MTSGDNNYTRMLCQYPEALLDGEYWQSILVVVVTNVRLTR